MADELDLPEIMRRTVQANAKLYKGWVDLSLEYFRAVADIFGGVPEAAPSPAEDLGDNAGAVVLEGEESTAATAAFLVTNDLGRKLQCSLVASDFRDAAGNRIGVKLSFEPARFELSPGQRGVVQVTVPIDRKLAEGVAYSGEISIEGMDGFSVPAVIRRRHTVDMSPIDRVSEEAGATAGSKGAGTRTAGRKTTRKTSKRTAKKQPAKNRTKKSGRGKQ